VTPEVALETLTYHSGLQKPSDLPRSCVRSYTYDWDVTSKFTFTLPLSNTFRADESVHDGHLLVHKDDLDAQLLIRICPFRLAEFVESLNSMICNVYVESNAFEALS
jgi:hypothetical protein